MQTHNETTLRQRIIVSRQCDQIGQVLKCLVDKISYKSSQNACRRLGYFNKTQYLVKLVQWQLLGDLLETSGHIVSRQVKES